MSADPFLRYTLYVAGTLSHPETTAPPPPPPPTPLTPWLNPMENMAKEHIPGGKHYNDLETLCVIEIVYLE